MDQPKYITLVEALSGLIDPRKARGKRYAWMLLLTLIAIALASGQRTVHAMADWCAQHWEELQAELRPAQQSCPSESTFRRVLRLIDPQAIEDVLTHLDVNRTPGSPMQTPPVPGLTSPPPLKAIPLQAQAVDGKELRGALAHGEKVHLVSLVRHADAITIAQTAVDQKSNEIPA